MKTENLTKYLEENSIEIEDVKIKGKKIEELKICIYEFGEYFLKVFNSFEKAFKNCTDKEVEEFLEKNKKHFNEVLKLYNEHKEYSVNYGKSRIKNKMIVYVQDNYLDICEFIDVYLEVKEE